ncbi:MAG: hypothetical protein EOP02_02790 [Proteobacteria bacterium]|nr:MAG: hypothetical protein EOP02_02790 [Pseudomonadota bacterium]
MSTNLTRLHFAIALLLIKHIIIDKTYYSGIVLKAAHRPSENGEAGVTRKTQQGGLLKSVDRSREPIIMDSYAGNGPLDDGFRTKPFIRTRRQPHPPGLWRWEVCVEGDVLPYQVSACVHRSAHDAWEAGQTALEAITQSRASQRAAESVVEPHHSQQ